MSGVNKPLAIGATVCVMIVVIVREAWYLHNRIPSNPLTRKSDNDNG